jgi:UDP-N-acetylmuramate dehydrogenase
MTSTAAIFAARALPNTLGIESMGRRVAEIRSVDDLIAARRALSGDGDEVPMVLGAGSNVVLPARVDRPVLLMQIRGLAVAAKDQHSARLEAAAGERWHDVVRFALGQGLGGLENLALIPGTAGAAPVQNIGAYGVEIASCLESLQVFDWQAGRIEVWPREACAFGYRESVFKRPEGRGRIILGLSLALKHARTMVADYPDIALELNRFGISSPQPIDIAEAVIRVRRRKLPDPRRVGNVGSFFKNPLITAEQADRIASSMPDLVRYQQADGRVKLAAAQLIDRGGWRGRVRGSAAVWKRQALVLVNGSGAGRADVLDLAAAIQADVAARYGVTLELEPQVL